MLMQNKINNTYYSRSMKISKTEVRAQNANDKRNLYKMILQKNIKLRMITALD